MKFTLEINLENSAFEVEGHEQAEAVNGYEIAVILKSIARYLGENGPVSEYTSRIRDTNGNTVGDWTVTP
jgi:hypothetical protein